MKKIAICIICILAASCQKKPKPAEVQEHLRKAMSGFLYESVHNDSSKVKFDVKDVVFFEDKEYYECEFNVRMLQEGKDTTGVMRARITKDFVKVNRKL